MSAIRETDLYPPVKYFLEGQGYEVKAEIADNDVVAIRGDEPPVVVELKTAFTLALVFQGIGRQKLTDQVYLAIPDPGRTPLAVGPPLPRHHQAVPHAGPRPDDGRHRR